MLGACMIPTNGRTLAFYLPRLVKKACERPRSAQEARPAGHVFSKLHGLLFELDMEAAMNLALDQVAQRRDIGRGGMASVDERKGVARGDSGLAEGKALWKASMFEEPRGGEFDIAVVGSPVGDFFDGNVQVGGDAGQDGCRDDGIFEEGAGTAAVGFALDDQHALAVTDLADGVVDLHRRRSGAAGEVALQVGVGELWSCGEVEAKGDLGDDVAVAMGRVEDAAAVGEPALLMREGDEGVGRQVEGADLGDGVGDLLAVGSDVLDWGAPDRAWDAGEALDAGDSLLADAEDEAVPLGAGGGGVVDVSAFGAGVGGGADGDVEDEAVEAGVADEEIAAAAEDEDFEAVPAGEVDSLEEFGFGADFAEEARRTADAEGSVRGERDLLLEVDGGRWHGLESTTPERDRWRGGGGERTIGRGGCTDGPPQGSGSTLHGSKFQVLSFMY